MEIIDEENEFLYVCVCVCGNERVGTASGTQVGGGGKSGGFSCSSYVTATNDNEKTKPKKKCWKMCVDLIIRPIIN